jgi:histidinol-phosphate aminotransferase
VVAVRRDNASERDWLRTQLLDRGLAVAPSQTNFLLADFGRDATALESALVARGVVLRPMAGYGLPDCLRITVGLRQENTRLLAALDEVLA